MAIFYTRKQFQGVIFFFHVNQPNAPEDLKIKWMKYFVSFAGTKFFAVAEPGTQHMQSVEIYIWTLYRLCFEEPLLWDGDAYSVRAIRYQLITGYTEGPGRHVWTMINPYSRVISITYNIGNLACLFEIEWLRYWQLACASGKYSFT